jgi:hypothetical protein
MDRRTFSRRLATALAVTPTLVSKAFGAVQPLAPTSLTVDGAAAQGSSSSSASMDLGLNANLKGSRLYSNSSWYQDISALPVHANSGTYLATLGSQVYSQDAGGWTYNGSLVGIPYFVVDSSLQPFVPVVCQQYFESCDLVYAPIPLRDDIIEGYPGNPTYPATPNPEVDRHLVVIDRNKRVVYELYKAYRRNDHWYCSNIAVWDLDGGDVQRPYGNTSVDVAGQSVIAGLLLGHQVTGNTLDHALRFTIQHQCPNFFSPPAAHASAFGNANALPFGGRLRLKASVSESTSPGGTPWNANALRIVRALKKYGMINADTGLALSSQGDTSAWDAGNNTGGPAWQQLRELTTSHFDVVNTGATLYSANSPAPSGTAPTAALNVSAAEIATGQSVTLTPSWTGKTLAWLTPVGHAMKSPAAVSHSPVRDTWYQLEVANPYGRVRTVKRVIVTDGAHRYASYDRYVGPNGSLSNDGASASTPWPITVLTNPDKRHLIAGYVIGLLDGTYDMSSLSSADYDYPLIDIPTGTFGRPTVLQAVNRRQAILSGGSNSRPLLGSRYQGLSVIQIIGLKFNTPAAAYSVYFSSDGAVLIDDCEFTGFQAAAIRLSAVSSPFVRANTAHNTSSTMFARLGGCSDVRIRGSLLDVTSRIWEEYGGANVGVAVD